MKTAIEKNKPIEKPKWFVAKNSQALSNIHKLLTNDIITSIEASQEFIYKHIIRYW